MLLIYISYYSTPKSLYIQVGFILLLGTRGPALYLRAPYRHPSIGIYGKKQKLISQQCKSESVINQNIYFKAQLLYSRKNKDAGNKVLYFKGNRGHYLSLLLSRKNFPLQQKSNKQKVAPTPEHLLLTRNFVYRRHKSSMDQENKKGIKLNCEFFL